MKEIINKIDKALTPKRLAILFTTVLLLSLIPMVILGFYAHPEADDFSYGEYGKIAWNQSHNVFAVFIAAIRKATDTWRDWQGFYFSNFAMALSPNAYGEGAYKVTTPIILSFICVGIWFVIRQIFTGIFDSDKYSALAVSSIATLLVIQCMPNAARHQAFFWYNGASTYVIVGSISLMLYGCLILLYNKPTVTGIVLVSVLAFLQGGSNLVTALNVAIVLAFAWILLFVLKKQKEVSSKALIAPTICYYIGFILNCAAPGNWNRAEESPFMNPVKAILLSLEKYFTVCMDEWMKWPIIVALVLLIPIFALAFRKSSFKFGYPGIVIILAYCVTSAMMTPPLYAASDCSAGRIVADIYTMFILTTVLSEAYLVGWAVKKYGVNFSDEEGDSVDMAAGTNARDGLCYGVTGLVTICATVLFLICGSVLTIIPNDDYYTSAEAFSELRDGTAATYSSIMEERHNIYISGEKNVVVPAMTVSSNLLYGTDMTGDNTEWVSRIICRYYELESISVE